ncbi:2-C-methyl-D-erythritol 4-phosphate cytidylyltransferase [hydrothermal vent metagenome]|uniref:2-C-methyl-D-erythritol 4-phosphate cytidylyltransferase n=1 Tax=hydrothermal vent metagenome TaxID=652676 RepID=A0A3B1AXI3_9ZZZZ
MPSSSSLVTRHSSQNHWAVIPAAGVGKRMRVDVPKQYLSLCGKPVIAHTIERLAAQPQIKGLVVALSEDDAYWTDLVFAIDKPLWRAAGGAERCHSVLNALHILSTHADDNDWVLVHDAARPCVRTEDISLLIDTVTEEDIGGLLAIPVRDTMKRSNKNTVVDTVDRNGLWHALTPQMFRLGTLRAALIQTLEDKALVTDESSAMELAQYAPVLVEGHADNIKITRPEDLILAEFYLQQQETR